MQLFRLFQQEEKARTCILNRCSNYSETLYYKPYQVILAAGVDQVMGCMTRVHFPEWAEKRLFLFATASVPALGATQHPILWVLGALSMEVM